MEPKLTVTHRTTVGLSVPLGEDFFFVEAGVAAAGGEVVWLSNKEKTIRIPLEHAEAVTTAIRIVVEKYREAKAARS